mmetsp:Transcript_26715/g.43410  ORF Transcript_26715/g.43410 Transcript_26715/m.43410 type:complete len:299 (-) Transcript_26715:380-1276(-)
MVPHVLRLVKLGLAMPGLFNDRVGRSLSSRETGVNGEVGVMGKAAFAIPPRRETSSPSEPRVRWSEERMSQVCVVGVCGSSSRLASIALGVTCKLVWAELFNDGFNWYTKSYSILLIVRIKSGLSITGLELALLIRSSLLILGLLCNGNTLSSRSSRLRLPRLVRLVKLVDKAPGEKPLLGSSMERPSRLPKLPQEGLDARSGVVASLPGVIQPEIQSSLISSLLAEFTCIQLWSMPLFTSLPSAVTGLILPSTTVSSTVSTIVSRVPTEAAFFPPSNFFKMFLSIHSKNSRCLRSFD